MTNAQPPNEELDDRIARASAAWGTAEAPSAAAERPSRGFLIDFLAENWLWIVVPALLVIALLGGTALYLSVTNEGDSTTPFVYATYD